VSLKSCGKRIYANDTTYCELLITEVKENNLHYHKIIRFIGRETGDVIRLPFMSIWFGHRNVCKSLL